MTKPRAKAILRAAFAALTPRQRANLRMHARRGDGVACGRYADKFVSPKGYG